MTDKASPAGWVVQVTIPAPPQEDTRWTAARMSRAPSHKYYNVAIANPDKAIEATTKYLAKINADAGDDDPRTVRELSSAEVAALGLKAGEVKPA
jgi:hypothetical protein